MVRESTRKVVCASNMRQVGLAINMFSEDHNGLLPDSQFLPASARAQTHSVWMPNRMDTVFLSYDEFPGSNADRWDGLGHLVNDDYLNAPNTLYCPSHRGGYMFEDAEESWARLGDDEIIVNYLYRGMGPDQGRRLYRIRSEVALMSDTIRSYNDLNHADGFNVLQAGLAVGWYEDIGGQITNDLLLLNGQDNDSTTVQNAWNRLDQIPGLAD